MRRALSLFTILLLVAVVIVLRSDIKDFFWAHAWWRSVIAALPTIAAASVAFLQWRDSSLINDLQREANDYRDQANKLRQQNNALQEQANDLNREANEERTRANEALARIAGNTARPRTLAEVNAEKLTGYLGSSVQVVNGDDSRWPGLADIVEVRDGILTLFSPSSYSSPGAFETCVRCEDVEITEAPAGNPPLTLKVLRRYGTTRQLGEIKRWDERLAAPARPAFSKGSNVFHAEYVKAGSAERRRLDVFESADGTNFFMLVPSSGEPAFGK